METFHFNPNSTTKHHKTNRKKPQYHIQRQIVLYPYSVRGTIPFFKGYIQSKSNPSPTGVKESGNGLEPLLWNLFNLNAWNRT